eukprot:150798-Pyramimonas_sp.AAC.1
MEAQGVATNRNERVPVGIFQLRTVVSQGTPALTEPQGASVRKYKDALENLTGHFGPDWVFRVSQTLANT